jgi:phosphoglycerate dehydrogenase-like enzyme
MANSPVLRVHTLHTYTPEGIADLRERLSPNIQFTSGDNAADLAACHILIAGRPQREQLEAGQSLRSLIIPWAGLPAETRTLLADFPDISAHNLHHNAGVVAELTTALLLAAAKRIIPFDRALREGDWSMRYAPPGDVVRLEGKTVLVLGYGAIGQRVARICRAMGMHVLATRRRPPFESDGVAAEIHPPQALPDLLPRANALVIALPQTPETTDLIGKAQFDLLPSGSILVNIGRGPIVNEEALYAALVDGRLAAAGLDVWYRYPETAADRAATPPTTLPFANLENVVFSPHRAGLTADTETLRMSHLADLLNTAAAGNPLPNEIDLEQGY